MEEECKKKRNEKKKKEMTQIVLFRGILKESVNVDFRGKLGCDGEREREEEDEEEEQLSALAHFPFDGILPFFSVVLKTKFFPFRDDVRGFSSFF